VAKPSPIHAAFELSSPSFERIHSAAMRMTKYEGIAAYSSVRAPNRFRDAAESPVERQPWRNATAAMLTEATSAIAPPKQ